MILKSASALAWAAAIALVVGTVVLSPAGGMFLYGVAAVLAAIAILGPKLVRLAGIVLLLAALFMAWRTYPQYVRHRDSYLERAADKTEDAVEDAAHEIGQAAARAVERIKR